MDQQELVQQKQIQDNNFSSFFHFTFSELFP